MKLHARYAAWALPLLLTGCFPLHKPQPKPNQSLAPLIADLPRPPVQHPDLPESAATIPLQPIATDTAVEQEPVPPVRHHHPRPVQQAVVTPPTPPPDPGVSAIGQLSTGDPSDLRRQTIDLIASAQHDLNALGHALNDQEKKTANQIREYLKQAKEALNSGDVDGAHTLVAKARVLLSEFHQ